MTSSKAVEVAAALVFARSGDTARAQKLIDSLRQKWPSDTLLVNYWLPTILAAVALGRGDAKEALLRLDATAAYELGGDRPPFAGGASLYPVYLRGQAYLKERDWNNAQAEFRKMIASRGLLWNFPLAPLANLQLARAMWGAGAAGTKTAYQQFLSAWDHADPEVPIYSEAKREIASLR